MNTATVTTKANATVISKLLKAQGFRRSTSATTKIRGYHIVSEGFEVTQSFNTVVVEYHYSRTSQEFNQLDQIMFFLENKGYAVKAFGGSVVKLAVTKVGA
jgi:hypothetical protein